MAIGLSTFLTFVMNMVPEADAELAAIIRNQLIKNAVYEYSKDRPDIATTDVTGDGGKYYAIVANLTSWSDELSRISAIQYPAPVIANDETPVYLEEDDWDQDYYAGAVQYLWLPHHAPAATETMRITYTAPYIWSAGTTTTAVVQASHGFSVNDYVYLNSSSVWVDAGVDNSANLLATHQVSAVADTSNFTVKELVVSVPEADFFAVCYKAACLICQAIAERFSRKTDSTITADSVGHTTRASEFSKRAKEFCGMYEQALDLVAPGGSAGNAAGRDQPMAQFVDLDPAPGFPYGRDYLFRGRGTR